MRYYLKQLRYLNGKLLEAIDAILARSKKPPVIVLQADEGFQADEATFGEEAMQQIRVKGLIASTSRARRSLPSRGRRTR